MEDTVDFILANLPLNYGNVSFDPLFTENILLVGSQNDLFLQDLIKKKTSVGHYYHADIEEFKDGTFIMAQRASISPRLWKICSSSTGSTSIQQFEQAM